MDIPKIIPLYSVEEQCNQIQQRLDLMIKDRANSLSYLIDLQLYWLKEDVEVKIRQLETLTPTLNKQKAAIRRMRELAYVMGVDEFHPIFL